MRVYLTGAAGFVGSNVARVFAERHGARLVCPVHGRRPPAGAPYVADKLDLTDAAAVRRRVRAQEPDAIVHCAILNDLGRLYGDRRRAWDAYLGATRNLVDAANATGAHLVLVSTDWVFDGTQGGAAEDTPPNPINAYGFLKAACELVVDERAQRGAVARISGVNGVHRARADTPRRQDAGFGYLVASIVEALRAGRRFTVWESHAINGVATPTLASDAAELLWRIVERGQTGILHCCGGETVDRATLARRAVEAFDLDGDLLAFRPPEPGAVPPPLRGRVPYDTSLDARATAAALDVALPRLDSMLARLRAEIDTGRPHPLEAIAA